MSGMTKRRIVALALAALMLFTVGCDAESRQFIIDLALEWAKEHAIDVGKYTLLGRSGDDEVDAVMGARDVIANLQEADKLMEEGRAKGDLTKMEQAVEKRPGDYTYRVSYGAALLRSGNAAEAEAQFVAADTAVTSYGSQHVQDYATQGIDELGALRPGFQTNGFATQQQCETYFKRLAYFYGLRYQEAQESYFQSQQTLYARLAESCR
jgi:hypothetical protein